MWLELASRRSLSCLRLVPRRSSRSSKKPGAATRRRRSHRGSTATSTTVPPTPPRAISRCGRSHSRSATSRTGRRRASAYATRAGSCSHGSPARTARMPVEDVIFTASLLARIFDDDLGLGARRLAVDLRCARSADRHHPVPSASDVARDRHATCGARTEPHRARAAAAAALRRVRLRPRARPPRRLPQRRVAGHHTRSSPRRSTS